jgi:hypothetical protein
MIYSGSKDDVMKNKLFNADERTAVLTGNIAIIFLGLTQTALLVSILYRRFALDQGEDQYGDMRLILLLSVLGYLAARLYYGAILPVLSLKWLVGIYIGLVAILLVVLSLWLGLPDLADWQNTILPVVSVPAILVFGYGLLAHFSKKRIEKEIFDDEEN